jgi:hypothetical protein
LIDHRHQFRRGGILLVAAWIGRRERDVRNHSTLRHRGNGVYQGPRG